MKKAVVLLSVVSLFFAGCSNYFDGKELKNSIENEISYEQAQIVKVRTGCEPVYGAVYTDKNDFRVGFAKEVSFVKSSTFDNDYVYYGFECVDSSDNTKKCDEYIKVEPVDSDNPLTQTAKVTVLSYAENLYVRPVIYNRPKLLDSQPDSASESIAITDSIILSFNTSFAGTDSLVITSGEKTGQLAGITVGLGSKQIGSDGLQWQVEDEISKWFCGTLSSNGKILTLKMREKSFINSLDATNYKTIYDKAKNNNYSVIITFKDKTADCNGSESYGNQVLVIKLWNDPNPEY